MSEHQQNDRRKLLGRLPARTVILDMSPPFNSQIGEEVCDVLENLFALACNLNGPSRIPFFSVIALNGYPELLLPLSFVKNNFERIQKALCDLRNISSESLFTGKNKQGGIVLGIMEACSHYRRQIHTMMQSGGLCHQLEVIVITCQNSSQIQKQIEDSSVTLDLDNLKKIQVISLTSLDFSLEEGMMSSSQGSLNSAVSSSSIDSGLVETLILDADALSLQNFFNTWLLDSGTDTEHMHIILPSNSDIESLIVKCDLQERVLNPAQLPCFGQFTLNPDAHSMKLVFPSTSKAMGMSVPIYKLRVIKLLPASSLCDSTIFGMPMVAQATSCWKVDWDDLERNQEIFHALCNLLIRKDVVMIAQLENSNSDELRSLSITEKDSTYGYFVVLPAQNRTLLVKSLACQELLLPCQAPSQLEEPTEEKCKMVASSLEKVELIDTFNPLMYASGLFSCIRNKQKRKNTSKLSKRKSDLGTTFGMPVSNKSSLTKSGPERRDIRNSRNVEILSNAIPPQSAKKMKIKDQIQFPTHL